MVIKKKDKGSSITLGIGAILTYFGLTLGAFSGDKINIITIIGISMVILPIISLMRSRGKK